MSEQAALKAKDQRDKLKLDAFLVRNRKDDDLYEEEDAHQRSKFDEGVKEIKDEGFTNNHNIAYEDDIDDHPEIGFVVNDSDLGFKPAAFESIKRKDSTTLFKKEQVEAN